jgi:AcrR family transcriptional regulator
LDAKREPTAKPHPPKRARTAGLVAHAQKRKEKSREQLISAATKLFCTKGYYSISIDDIASAAGVTRMTFYRHFQTRAEILGAIFERVSTAAMPRLMRIRDEDFHDPRVVRSWVVSLFESDRANRHFLQAFSQAIKIDKEFMDGSQKLIFRLIEELGEKIPAFDVPPDGDPQSQRRWLEAWLLLYEIFDQSNQAAFDVITAANPIMLDILTARFVEFVERYPLSARG